MKIKLCFINFVLLLIALHISACNPNKSISPEAERFEKVLKQNVSENYQLDGDYKYVLWNENSCHGCKVKSINILNKLRPQNVKIIAPNSDKKLASNIDSQFVIIDRHNEFGKYYYGVSNIGIVNIKNGKVTMIKNYNVDEMDKFETDLQ